MKNILLTVLVFGIVGCASTADFNDAYRSLMDEPKSQDRVAKKIASDYKMLPCPRSQAMFFSDLYPIKYKVYQYGNAGFSQAEINEYVLLECEKKFSGRCLIALEGDKDVWKKNLDNHVVGIYGGIPSTPDAKESSYKHSEITPTCVSNSKLEEARSKIKLEEKKSTCRDYGFKDDSDGMGMCLIELDKLAAIQNQSAKANEANQAQLQALQQQQAEAKRQREANALINLGAIIGGAGTPAPSSTRSKATTPSYPTYTSSMTVPSNQLCPQLASRLVKQEVVRGNRICYYQ